MTVARIALPMLPRAQVESASDRFEHLSLGTLEPVVPCTHTGDLARPGLSSATRRFLTQPTPLSVLPLVRGGAGRPGANHDLAMRACHDNLRRSRALGAGSSVAPR